MFLPRIAPDNSAIIETYSLLDGGANYSSISTSCAKDYPLSERQPREPWNTGGGLTRPERWVRVPFYTGSRIVYLDMAVYPKAQLPLWCQMNIAGYDYENVLKVNEREVKQLYAQGERLFCASFLDEGSPATMAMELEEPEDDWADAIEREFGESFHNEIQLQNQFSPPASRKAVRENRWSRYGEVNSTVLYTQLCCTTTNSRKSLLAKTVTSPQFDTLPIVCSFTIFKREHKFQLNPTERYLDHHLVAPKFNLEIPLNFSTFLAAVRFSAPKLLELSSLAYLGIINRDKRLLEVVSFPNSSGATDLQYPQKFCADQDGPSLPLLMHFCLSLFQLALNAISGVSTALLCWFGFLIFAIATGAWIVSLATIHYSWLFLPLLFWNRTPIPKARFAQWNWLKRAFTLFLLFHIPAAHGELVCTAESFPMEILTQNPTPAWGLWAPSTPYESFLAEKWCRIWLSDSPPTVVGRKTENPDELLEDVDINPSLANATKRALQTALKDQKVLSYYPGKFTKVKLELDLKPGFTPQSSAPRAQGPAQAEILTLWIKEQEALQLYERASEGCQWASCLHIAPTWTQSADGTGKKLSKIRVCGDYRAVNEELVNVAQVVPRISEIKQRLTGFKFYARFDMAAGFNAVELDEKSRDILAIRTPIGLFRPTRMPFGPKNNPSKYQKIVESLVNHIPQFGKGVFVYMDDILVGANSEAGLVKLVQQVLHGVRKRGGTIKPSKVRIGYPTEVILGSEVSEEGIRPSPTHVAAVDAIRLPTTPSEMRSVVGLFTYFFEHFEWFSHRMAPLHKYMRDDVDFPNPLPEEVQAAIAQFKLDMKSRPLLVAFDPARQLFIDSDSSLIAAGVCVYHMGENGEREPIAYFSKKYSATESKWPPYVREAFALTWALSKSRDFVEAAQDTAVVYIDQKPLLWLKTARSPKVVRWVVEVLQELDYKLRYRPGPEHLGADAFSRVPCVEPGVPTETGFVVAIQRLLSSLPLPNASATRHRSGYMSQDVEMGWCLRYDKRIVG